MIVSKTYRENYFSYLIFEILIVSLATGLLVGCLIFYSLGQSESRWGADNLSFLLSNFWILILISAIPALLSGLVVVYFRRRSYIVGFKADVENIILQVRGLSSKSMDTIVIKRSDARITKFEDPAFLIVPRYKGYRIMEQSSGRKFEFVSNNFIWEKQIKDNVHICQLLGAMVK